MIKPKTFWFINQYSSTPETAMGGRHFYIAQELAKKGHQVYVIAGSYSHLLRKPKIFDGKYLVEKIQPNFSFVWLNLPQYSEAHSKQRVVNWFRFSRGLRGLKKFLKDKPDVVLYSSPSPLGSIGAQHLASFFNVPFVFEVRDIWPLTLVELGGHSKKHPFIRLMQWIEDRSYKKANYVFSNLSNAIEHMQTRGLSTEKFHWIPNGVSLAEVSTKESLSSDVLAQIPQNKFLIGYTGTIGVANAIDDLIDAAQLVSHIPDIHFVLVGAGKEKSEMLKKASELGLTNITFIDAIPKKQIQSMLDQFDVCYIGWQKNPLYRFGIAPNKLPEYLLAGKPVLHAFSGNGDLVKLSKSGISVEAEDPSAIAKAILNLYELTEEQRIQMGINGRTYVMQHLDYAKIADKLEKVIFS